MHSRAALLLRLALLSLWLPACLQAQQPDPAAAQNAAADAADAAMLRGPQTVALLDQATLALPADYGFVPAVPAAKLMETWGNRVRPGFLGLVLPLAGDRQRWFITLDYEASGHVRDDDAKRWNTDVLLERLRQGTAQANARRQQLGIATIGINRWVEAPRYDEALHQLVWAAEVRQEGVEDGITGVNYNSYVLGREGVVSSNLIANASTLQDDLGEAQRLWSAIRFNQGRSYDDFNLFTDEVASYGLQALVAGLAANDNGLMGTLSILLMKSLKYILLALALLALALPLWFRLQRGNKQD